MSASKKTTTTNKRSQKKVTPKKKAIKKASPLRKIFSLARANKLIVALLLIVVLLLAALINQKYQDWDNAQMIKGLARDFPALVEEIESATGLDLEVKYECMKTEEKFTEGVNICELIYYGVNESDSDARKAFEAISKNSKFEKGNIFENKEGFKFNYRNKKSCSFTDKVDIYGSCIIAVKESNIELAKNLLAN